jgi:hypothetical protein
MRPDQDVEIFDTAARELDARHCLAWIHESAGQPA